MELRSPEGPGLLYEAWCFHTHSAPTGEIGVDAWVEMFRAAGAPVLYPTNVPAPTGPLTLYRGTHPARARGMSWTDDPVGAGHYRQGRLNRHHREAHVYETTAALGAVLAVFRQGADALEYVLDPVQLGEVIVVE